MTPPNGRIDGTHLLTHILVLRAFFALSSWFFVLRSRSQSARTSAELGSKRAIEVRDVAEAAVEGDIEHLLRLGKQSRGRVAQARAAHVLMWGDASDSPERPQEVIRAEVGLSRQAGQRMVGVGMTISSPAASAMASAIWIACMPEPVT